MNLNIVKISLGKFAKVVFFCIEMVENSLISPRQAAIRTKLMCQNWRPLWNGLHYDVWSRNVYLIDFKKNHWYPFCCGLHIILKVVWRASAVWNTEILRSRHTIFSHKYTTDKKQLVGDSDTIISTLNVVNTLHNIITHRTSEYVLIFMI